MSEISDGGPAFSGTYVRPQITVDDAFTTEAQRMVTYSGMSLRDWFAGQALQGICTHERFSVSFFGPTPPEEISEYSQKARLAYQIADAMLKEREKNVPS